MRAVQLSPRYGISNQPTANDNVVNLADFRAARKSFVAVAQAA